MNKKSITEAKEIFARELAENELSSLDVDTYLTCAANHVQDLPNPVDGGGSTRLFEFMRLAKAHPDLMRLTANDALHEVEQWLGYYSVPAGVTETDCHINNVTLKSEVAQIDITNGADRKTLHCHDRQLFLVLAQSRYLDCKVWLQGDSPEIVRVLSVGSGVGKRSFPMSVNCPGPDRWAEVLDMKVADAVPAFSDGWERVRYPRGWSPLNLAIARARHEPLVVANANEPGYAEFINIAHQLQFAMGDQPILLPVHKLAPKLEVSAMTISRHRTLAVKQGYLKVVGYHKYVPGGTGEATRYLFVGKKTQKLGMQMLHNESERN